MPPRAERIGRAQRKLGRGKGTNKGGYLGRARAQKEEKEREKRERIIVVVRSPCQENYPADAHPSAQVSAGVGKPPHGLGVCIWMYLVNGTGNSPSPGQPTPGVVKQDKSSGGSVDTTKTRSGPQRVRMSSGERPIGAAKGKQPIIEALCPTPPPLWGGLSFHDRPPPPWGVGTA